MKLYLAGPEVFHAQAVEIGRAKRAACAARGFDGLYPIDADVAPGAPPPSGAADAARIYAANLALIEAADAVVANVSPFKSYDCDPGTAWEIGFAAARGLLVCAYANDGRAVAERERALREAAAGAGGFGPAESLFPLRDTAAEDFGMPANLMIAESVARSGGFLELAPEIRPFEDLAAFEACLDRLAAKRRA
ncbi:MAG: nucleoside 2-deoxyribosyltransferase [Pseudomonadota bacterium]